MSQSPEQHVEKEFLASGYRLVAGMDEVGRGALAGPVSVGVVVVDKRVGKAPSGLKDSKLLTASAREDLIEPVRTWARAYGVGHASPAEIDRYGIVGALCLAGHRALAAALPAGMASGVVLLDGVHDWLSSQTPAPLPCATPPVVTQVKGDLRISAIAGASILAKTERDALMGVHHQEYPDYGWASNKGYGAHTHTAAIRRLGVTPLHRRSWKLPTGPEPVQDSLLGT